MANNKMTGIIFSNSHDGALGGLTARRSMGSVPFASRYRLVDLVLSRMSPPPPIGRPAQAVSLHWQ